MFALFRTLTPKPLRPYARRTVESLSYIFSGKLVQEATSDQLIGMTSSEERRFYESCVPTVADVEGAIVDLGCWMCSTTIPLARGIRHCEGSPDAHSKKIYAFDRFVWEEWMNLHISQLQLSCRYCVGESFLPEARGRLGEFLDDVELIEADLTDYRWNNGRIRILLVDAMKDTDVTSSITEQFYPHLTPGGLLIHQDYKHYYASWIHILQFRLREYCRFHHETHDGATVAFELLKEIPRDIAASAADFSDVTNDEADLAFQYSMDLVSDSGKSAVAAAHVMHFVHRSDRQSAASMLDRYAEFDDPDDVDIANAKLRWQQMG